MKLIDKHRFFTKFLKLQIGICTNFVLCNNIDFKAVQDITDKLNNFFASIGRSVSKFFRSADEMTQNIPSITNSILFREVSPCHIERIISSLNTKTCHISSYPAKGLKCIQHC